MYILKARYHDNVVINDLGINVLYNDDNGVLVEKKLFDKSSDAQSVKDRLIISVIENDFSMTPDKNVIMTELDLSRIQGPYENMTVFVRNYMESNNPAYALFVDGQWKFFAINGSGGSYIHPLTHSATMIVEDSEHRFVSDVEKTLWNKKSNFVGSYNDLTDKPTIPVLPTLATVSTTGNYADLTDKPEIPVLPTLATVATTGNYNDIINKPSFASIATTGSYADLTNKPTIPVLPILAAVATSGSYNDIVDKPVMPDISVVGLTGNYTDLINKPTIPNVSNVGVSGSYNDLINTPVLATVATTGSYNDLTDKPISQTDPETLATVATTGNYNDLINQPTIPDVSEVGVSGSYNDLVDTPVLATIATTGSYTDIIDTPVLATVATTGSYNDLTDKPISQTDPETLSTVATTGSYNDLIDKPSIYSKSEIDDLISTSNENVTGASRYEAIGSTNNSCIILATGKGVQFSKNGNSATLTIPVGVHLLSAQINFSSTEIGTGGNCTIDYGVGVDYTNIVVPTYQVINDVANSRAYKVAPYPAANLNTNAHTLQLTGLTANIGIWVKLTF